MLGDQVVDESGKEVEFALGRSALEDDIAVDNVAALGKVANDPGIGRPSRDQPDAIDFARLSNCAGWEQCPRAGGENSAPQHVQRITSAQLGGSKLRTEIEARTCQTRLSAAIATTPLSSKTCATT